MDPRRSTLHLPQEENCVPRSIQTTCNSPKQMSSTSGYALTADLPGTNISSQNGNN
jgi:hypothetical protein